MVSSGDLRTPQFNGENYDFWSVKMETILIAYDLWDVIEFGINTNSAVTVKSKAKDESGEEASGSKEKKAETEEVVVSKENRIKNAKALSIIQGALTDELFHRIRNEKTAHGAWNVLKREYRGDKRVRAVKLQAVRGEFEYMRMGENESLEHYLAKFFEVVNNLKSLGEEVPEKRIVQKLLMSLSRRYKSIVSIIEETRDLDVLRAEEVIASVKVFDRREDLHDERESSAGIEKAFSSLKVGYNQGYAAANRPSNGKCIPRWPRQDQGHSRLTQGGNVHNNHSTSWNHRAGINSNNSYNTQNIQGSSGQGIVKPQCQVCYKYHFGICRYKGKARCSKCNQFGHNTNDCNDYKQLANCAKEKEEVSIANLFYACHAASVQEENEEVKKENDDYDDEDDGDSDDTDEEQAASEIAILKSRGSASDVRLVAAHEQMRLAEEDAAEWKRKYDIVVRETKVALEKVANVQERTNKETQLREDAPREEFSSHLVVKEDEIKEKNRRIEYVEQCLTTLNLELKAAESKMQSYGTEISSLKLEIKVLVEKLETANAKAQSYDKEKIHLEQRYQSEFERFVEVQERCNRFEKECKRALHEHRQALQQDVARLQEQLQTKRDKRKVLEVELNTFNGPLQVPVTMNENKKADYEEEEISMFRNPD